MGTAKGARKAAASRLGVPFDIYESLHDRGYKWCGDCRCFHTRSAFGIDRSRGDNLSTTCLYGDGSRPGQARRRRLREHGLDFCRKCNRWRPKGEVRGGLCRDHQREAYRKWYRRNAEKKRQQIHARKRGINPIPAIGRRVLNERYGGKCAYCQSPADGWDHIDPVSRGGETEKGNIVPCCTACNSSKKDRTDWLAWLEGRETRPHSALLETIAVRLAFALGTHP